MYYIRNSVHLLSYIRPAMKEEDLRLVLRATLYNMSRLLRSDGGFSRELAHSPSAPNVAQVKNGASYPGMPKPVHLSEGLVEGDMNAATQALLIRSLCYAMADETPPKLVQRADEFYDGMMERRTLFMLHPTIATPMEWARAACDSLMSVYLPEELPPASRWHYHQGVFLCGMEMLWEAERDERYDAYIKRYVDRLVDDHGNFDFARDELDAIQAGLLLFRLDERNGGSKYRAAADKLRYLFHTLNRTSEGGFWHKDKYAYNMWLDGLYMGGVFALKYAKQYGDTGLRDMALHQERLMRRYMRDERTGLLYHAWDESRRMPWADRETGCSPEFWGRSLGWYGLALAQFLDELPEEHAGRNELASSLADFAEALARYQDAESGLWYQVVDKGYLADNWLETSCTCLFVYTLAKAYKFGLVGEACLNAAKRGYEGLTRVLQFDEKGRFILPDICIGTSAGDYENYVTRPTSQNDLHGVGAFVMASVEMQALLG
ncbi:unsaturated rhamnogalacturonyl hydrolase [Paenibacillus harenae]|uniref:Unsaturated rhamnogalacturonyl hydrolase n=2 Tax=Paenibacillus harenae TaxID=306543 RepID=A0ABT9U1G5_PAEHA|nr:unsaturated rhamnogalacturonyl hydrolase [Paenibacillus harenae]